MDLYERSAYMCFIGLQKIFDRIRLRGVIEMFKKEEFLSVYKNYYKMKIKCHWELSEQFQ